MENRDWRPAPQKENPTKKNDISDLRQAIDDVDQSIAELLNKRLMLARKIGAMKAVTGRPVKDERREQEVLQHVAAAAADPTISKAIINIYAALLAESCAVQSESRPAETAGKTAEAVEPKTLYFPRVAIIGVGLIGGAIARQIKSRMPNTTVVGNDSSDVLKAALHAGLVDEGSPEIANTIKKASLILLCAPPEQNMQLLKQIAPLTKTRQVVVDVTSTKSSICQLAQKLQMKAEFIGGHPLFGSHQQGLENASAIDIEGRTFCLVSNKNTSDLAVRRLIRWLSDLGLSVEQTTAQTHDDTVAATSHLVQLLATTLGNMLADETTGSSKTKAALSGPALQGMARLMNSPSQLWIDIVRQNETAICQAIDRFTEELQDTKQHIANHQESKLAAKFTSAARFAEELTAPTSGQRSRS